MERSTKSLIVILVAVAPLVAMADVVMVAPPPPPPALGAGESFPESRFGAPPLQPDLGVRAGYSLKALRELEGGESDRKPAGLEFSDKTGKASSNAVIQEPGMPKSQANQNPIPSAASRSGTQEIALIAGDLGFFPKTVFVTRDIPVRIYVTSISKKPLCIMMDSFEVRKQVRAQKIEEVNFVPTTPGKFRFYCPVNGMEGTLLVKELSSNLDGLSREPASVSRKSVDPLTGKGE